jgi:hypothetical protein
MTPVDVAPLEARQFELLLKRSGADPSAFCVRKYARDDGEGFRVRVVGRGAATLYETRHPTAWTAGFAADLENGLFGVRGIPEANPQVAQLMRQIEAEIAEGGLVAALSFLNARVPHRFTAVYRLDGPVLRNVAVADKHRHLDAPDLQVVPLTDSFCQFVLRDRLFLTIDSGADARLAGHPYSGIVGSYVGVPISRGKGTLDGTLCHFDMANHPISDDEFLLLARAAHLMPTFLDTGV